MKCTVNLRLFEFIAKLSEKGEVVTMVYLIRARDGASSLCLRRDTRESAEITAVILREKGYADVEIVMRQEPQKAA